MRTLKKTLCLVLAVVLCFGLVGTAFAGNLDKYSDAKDIDANYVEAVDLFTGLGIVEGDAGAIAPNGTFTRAAVAKIAAYMTLGATAKNLAGATSKYTDVAANYWGMPFIAYCDSVGLIEGDGNGLFRPDDAITGFEGAVILLRCLGYGAKGEYSKSDWTLNASKDGLKLGIFNKDLIVDGANSGTALQRDQAMQMAFNAMFVNTVKWSTIYNDYVANTQQTSIVGSTLNPVQLIDNFDCKVVTDNDGYGFYGHTYKTAKGAALSDFYKNGTVVGKLVGPMTAAAVKAEYSASNIVSGYTYIYNGRTETAPSVSTLLNSGVNAGVTVYLMDEQDSKGNCGTDGKIDKVVMVEEYVYAVTAVDKTAKTATVNGWTVKNTLDLVKGDLVICVPNFDTKEFISIAKATVGVTGKVTGTAAGYIRVDGKDLYLARVIGGESITLGNRYDFYLDSTGAIVYVANEKVEEAALNYVYVVSSQSKAADASLLDGSPAQAKAKIVSLKGESSVVDLYTFKKTDGTTYYVNTAGADTEVPGTASDPGAPISAGFYSYVVKDGGGYVFTALNDKKAVAVATSDKITTAAKSATVIVDKASDTDVTLRATTATTINVANKGVVTTITGYANFVKADYTATADNKVMYTLATVGVVSAIYVVNAKAAATAPVYAYYKGAGLTVSASETYYDFYVNGKVESYLLTTNTYSGVYTVTVTDGKASVEQVTTGLSETKTVTAVDAGYFVDADGINYYGTGYSVFDVTAAGAGAAATLAKGDTVTYVTVGNAVTVVYITNHA